MSINKPANIFTPVFSSVVLLLGTPSCKATWPCLTTGDKQNALLNQCCSLSYVNVTMQNWQIYMEICLGIYPQAIFHLTHWSERKKQSKKAGVDLFAHKQEQCHSISLYANIICSIHSFYCLKTRSLLSTMSCKNSIFSTCVRPYFSRHLIILLWSPL